MNRKRPCYEDYFRIPDPNSNSTENASDLDLEKAATLLCKASCALAGSMWQKRNPGRQLPRPEMGWHGMDQRPNPNFDDGRHYMTEAGTEPERFHPPPHDSRDMSGNAGGPQRFRPLRPSESHVESNWNLPDNRGQDHGGETYYSDEYFQSDDIFQDGEGSFEERSNAQEGQFERPYHNVDRYGPRPRQFQRPSVDSHSANDSQPHYNSRFQDRQPYDERSRQAGGGFVQNSNAADQCENRPEQSSTASARKQEDSCGASSAPAPSKDQESDKEETDDDSDEDTSFCKLCNIPFGNAQKYYMHTRGMLHTQRQMEANQVRSNLAKEQGQHQQGDGQKQPQQQDGQKQPQQQGDGQKQQQAETLQPQQAGTSVTAEPNTDAAEASGSQEQDEEYWEEEWEEEVTTDSNEFVCELCDVKTTGQKALIAHEVGRFHKAVKEAIENDTPVSQRIYNKLGPKAKVPDRLRPATVAVLDMKPVSGPSLLLELLEKVSVAVVGTSFIKEGRSKRQPSFFCTICESMCDASGILTHIIGSKHRMKYLRAHNPTIYEHVRNHGGKKSQLSLFLEEVCSDIEKVEGRKQPMLEKPDPSAEAENPAEKNESAKEEGEEKVENKDPSQAAKGNKGAEESQWRRRRNLPHDVVMAMYKENKTKSETEDPNAFRFGEGSCPQGQGLAPPWHNPERGPEFAPPWHNPDRGPEFAPPWHNPERGPGFAPPWHNPERGPGFAPPWHNPERGPFHNPDRGPPYLDMPRPPGPFPPPVRNFPDPFVSEEERLKRMYAYEAFLFDHPMLLVSPEEARCRMFSEYERIGIPYDIACDRVLVQEERRTKLMNLMRDSMSLKEAQVMLRKMESRKQLIREYEKQGLDSQEARWRAITEEEREKLYEKYENLGFTAMEARAKIMAGEDRIHLVQEFERHGMTPKEALRRAVAEEDRLKVLLAPSKTEQNLDDAADRRMLMTFLEQGDTRESAENKTIAVLRRQGVPTQEAILRVQKIVVKVPEKIDVKVPEKSHKVEPRRTHDEDRKDRDQEKQRGSRSTESFDNISPEEAKERLFQEYEKRGVPREKARIALIQELIRSGVPEEEAKRRFSDLKPTEATKREEKGSKQKHSRGKRSRSRSRSSSASRSSRKRRRSPSVERKYPRSYQDNRGRTDFRNDRRRLPEERRREEKDRDRRGKESRERERSRERPSRPTLTLGEELKLKAKKLKRAEVLSRLEDGPSTSARPGTSSQRPAEKPLPESKTDDKSVSQLLESLTDNLISSKDNESEALSMSKVLTSALLKYRLNTLTGEQEKPAASPTNPSFVERRIQDAKKLFETKMQPGKESPGPSGLKMTVDGGDRRVVWTGPESGSTIVDPGMFGLPPPLSSNSYKPQQPSRSGDVSSQSSRFQTRASPERKPIVPRVLLGGNSSSKGSSSSSRYRH